MSYHLTDLMTAVQGRVTSPAGVEWSHASGEAVYVHGAPPRVVWYPTSIDPEGALQGYSSGRGRSFASGIERIRIHCWGEDHEAAWVLHRAVLRGLWLEVGGGAEHLGSEWVRPDDGQTLRHGQVLVAEVAVSIAYRLADPTTVEIDRVDVDALKTDSAELGGTVLIEVTP